MLKKITAISMLIMFTFSICTFASDESAVTEYNGQNYVTKTQIWDLDFEDATIVPTSKTSLNIGDSAKKTLYNAAGDYIGANLGSANSSISLASNSDAVNKDNGVSVYMNSANTSDNVQFNNLLTTTSSDTVIVYELDVCAPDFNAGKNFHPQFYTNGGATKVWANTVSITKDGYFSYNGGTIKVEPNTWYNLKIVMDIPNSKEVCYVNDEFLGEYKINTTGFYSMFKLSISMSGAVSGLWLDNFNIYELTPLVSIDNATAGEDYIEITFSDSVAPEYFVKDGAIENITAVCEKTPVELISCTKSDEKDNTLIFKTASALSTAVEIDFEINYYNAIISGSATTPPGDIDVANVTITKDGESYFASADCINKTQDEKTVIMMLVLFDDNGKVVGIASSAQTNLTDGAKLGASADSSEATNAYVYFMTDWTSLRAFKNVIYYSK